MQTSQLELHNVKLHVLSPIHIGTEQELDPFSYVIRDNNLLLIDLTRWMEMYPEKEKLHSMMESDNFAEIRTFIAEKIDPETVTLASIPVENGGLLSTYERVIKTKDQRNQLLVHGMTRNEISQVAYIPGSSIKGAIRTAIGNRFVEAARVTSRNSHNYDENIFGKINKDPMRNLKLADVSLESFGSMIVEAEEYSLNEDKSQTPKGYKEVSANLCQSGEPVVYPLRLSMKPFSLHGQNVDVPFLIDALYRFYVSKYKEEYNKFYSLTHAKQVRQEIAPMSLEIANLRTNETLVRVGHFSHVECITFDHVRNPRTPKGKPYGTTRTLANGLYPFGWAKLEFVNMKSAPRPESDWPYAIQELERVIEAKKQTAERVKREAEAAQEIRKRQETERIAEEKRKAALKNMDPEDRKILEASDPSIIDNRVVEIYNEIDSFSDTNKIKLAKALKGRWIAEGRWDLKGKRKKSKQGVKVGKIKGILGE